MKATRRKLLLAVAGIALAIAVSACGGGGGGDATVNPLTKAQFLKKGNEVCAAGTAKVNEGFERYSAAHLNEGQHVSDISYARAMARIVLPRVEEQVEGIRKLAPPAGDEKRVKKILAAFEAGVREGKEDPLTLPGTHGSYAFEEAHELAIDYGLEKCALG